MKFGPWYCSSLLHPLCSRHHADAVTRSQQFCNIPRLLRCSQNDLPRALAGLSIRDTRRPQLLAKISKWKLDLECCVTDLSSAAAAAPAPAPKSSSPVAEELQALADVFVSLKVGLKETCVALAVELSKQGVMAVEDFSEVTEAEARDMMARAGMSKLQQNRVIQAEAERKSAAAAAAAAAAAEAQRKRDAESAAAKKAQEDLRKVRFLWWWWLWWWSILPPR